MYLLQRCYRQLTAFTLLSGRLSAWLALLLVLTMALVVALRYGFNTGSVALQELLLYFHGSLLMLAMAATLAHDEHVRVDVLYRRWSARTRAWVNLFGTVFLLLPFCAALFWLSLDYVLASWQQREGSVNNGLPYLYLLKSLLLVMPLLLAIQGLAELCRQIVILGGHHDSEPQQEHKP